MKRFHRFASATLALFCFAGGEAAAMLQNGSFESGWSAWSGSLSEFDEDGGLLTIHPVDFSTPSPYYELLGGGLAQLQLDSEDIWTAGVELYQTFVLADVNHVITVSFDWDWNPSSLDDVPAMQLVLTGGATGRPPVQFFDAILGETKALEAAAAEPLQRSIFTIDAGYFGESGSANLALSFGMTDMDFDLSDVLQIGNIEVTESATPVVPLPTSLLLFLSGLGAIGLVGRCWEVIRRSAIRVG